MVPCSYFTLPFSISLRLSESASGSQSVPSCLPQPIRGAFGIARREPIGFRNRRMIYLSGGLPW